METNEKKVLFYFVRHGQSEGNSLGIISGHTDHCLTEQGLEEAHATAAKVPSDYTTVYSSDLIRCRQTVEVVNTKKLPVVFDARLRERDFGSLSGKPFSASDPDGTLRKKDREQQYDYTPYGGESVAQVSKRLLACIEEIKTKARENERVLVITSAGIIRLMHHLQGNKEIMELDSIPNASVHEFEL